jgi:hypothetical protein
MRLQALYLSHGLQAATHGAALDFDCLNFHFHEQSIGHPIADRITQSDYS